MKKVITICFVSLWLLLIVTVGAYYVFLAPRETTYSEEENRNLQGFPEVSGQSIWTGDFMENVEGYLLDHFPGRSVLIENSNRFTNLLSMASHEEYLLIAKGPEDALDSKDYLGDLDNLLADLNVDTEAVNPGTENSDVVDTETPETENSDTEVNEEDPPIVAKTPVSTDEFPDTLGVYMEKDGAVRATHYYSKTNVMALTAVLNKYAATLPENGKLMFTMVPQSTYAMQFINSANKGSYSGDWDEVVNGLGSDNVYAFDAAEILTPFMKAEEYVYFRTDMHWTPYGSYLVYKEMAKQAGKVPADYKEDFTHTLEEPFRGTYYRDNPSVYMNVEEDSLDLLMPNSNLEWRRTTAKDEYKLIDFLDFNARANDRYTVYLGGPAGPWTYAQMDNEEKENCLIITDSFGLGYLPFLTKNYNQVHYYDPRYYNRETVGYTVSEMIEKYEIQDIYVVIGDLHSFDSSFIISNANSQLYGE